MFVWLTYRSIQAFFNGLLRDLGAKDIRVVEMFSVSAEDVQLLPYVLASSVNITQACSDPLARQPVIGFVLLCQYAGEEAQDNAPKVPKELWFANQVSSLSISHRTITTYIY